MATHSSVLAWRISGTAEHGGLLSTGLHRVGHNWSDLAAAAYVTLTTECGRKLLNSVHSKSKQIQRNIFPYLPDYIVAELKLLGWPKGSFGFLHKMLQKTRIYFLANPVECSYLDGGVLCVVRKRNRTCHQLLWKSRLKMWTNCSYLRNILPKNTWSCT